LGLVRGEAVPPMVTMPGELVVRASSGAAPHVYSVG
jgi:hypothetical protein